MKTIYHDDEGAGKDFEPQPEPQLVQSHLRMLAWENVKKGLWVEAPNIAAFLEKGQLVTLTDDTVIIGFTKEQAVARVRIERCLSIISHALSRMNGRDVLLKVIAL